MNNTIINTIRPLKLTQFGYLSSGDKQSIDNNWYTYIFLFSVFYLDFET